MNRLEAQAAAARRATLPAASTTPPLLPPAPAKPRAVMHSGPAGTAVMQSTPLSGKADVVMPSTAGPAPVMQSSGVPPAVVKHAPHWMDHLHRIFHPLRHRAHHEPRTRITHERPLWEAKGTLVGLDYGLTLSELHQVRASNGLEVVQVANPDGSSNLELVIARKQLKGGQRLEVEGPALNTSFTPGERLVSGRLGGLSVTGDLVDPDTHKALSYTVEVKATERTVAHVAAFVAPGALAATSSFLTSGAVGTVNEVVSTALAIGVPLIAAGIAASTIRWARRVLHDPRASKPSKMLAVAHAAADAARVVFPLAGTLANVGVIAFALIRLRHLRRLPPPEAAPKA